MNIDEVLKTKIGQDPRNRELLERARASIGRVPGQLAGANRKPDPVQALGNRPKVERRGKGSVVVIVTIIACRNHTLDDDNIVAGAKRLRDCVATSLGVDDSDKRVRWEYGCVETAGAEQTIVRIQLRQP